MVKYGSSIRAEAQQHPFYEHMADGQLVFIAHRGGDGGELDAWENTPEAFQAAADAGVRYVETDIRGTADDVAVHFHGATRRQKDLIGETDFVDLNTPEVLKKLGIPEGTQIPTLESTLVDFPNMHFFLDLKSENTPPAVVRAIQRACAVNRVSIDGHKWQRAVAVARELPGVSTTINPIGLWALYACTHDIPLKMDGLKVKVPGLKTLKDRWLRHATSLSVPINRAQPLMEMAQGLKIPVFAHNVKGETDIKEAVRIGAHGVMADELRLIPTVTSFATFGASSFDSV